jgi:hypothetical protein
MAIARRIGKYWIAIIVSLPTSIIGAVQVINDANQSALLWFLVASVGLNLSLLLVLIQTRKQAAPPPTHVTHNYFAPGSNPTLTIPPNASAPPNPPAQGQTPPSPGKLPGSPS